MTTHAERFQRMRRSAMAIGLFRQFAPLPQGGWADPQQPTHFPRAIDRSPLDVLGGQSLSKPTPCRTRSLGVERGGGVNRLKAPKRAFMTVSDGTHSSPFNRTKNGFYTHQHRFYGVLEARFGLIDVSVMGDRE
jgi:hypothetical protein